SISKSIVIPILPLDGERTPGRGRRSHPGHRIGRIQRETGALKGKPRVVRLRRPWRRVVIGHREDLPGQRMGEGQPFSTIFEPAGIQAVQRSSWIARGEKHRVSREHQVLSGGKRGVWRKGELEAGGK